jgi:hypothetical protein
MTTPRVRQPFAAVKAEGIPDVLTPLVLNVVGFAMLIAGWVAASGEDTFSRQQPYIDLAVGGAVVAGAGDLTYLLARRWAIRRRVASLRAADAGDEPGELDP